MRHFHLASLTNNQIKSGQRASTDHFVPSG
jgi:hypothetical protein